MDQAKQETMENAAEARALENEELKDVAGGGFTPIGFLYFYSCPECGWTGSKLDPYDRMDKEAARKLMQEEHNANPHTPGCTAEIKFVF